MAEPVPTDDERRYLLKLFNSRVLQPKQVAYAPAFIDWLTSRSIFVPGLKLISFRISRARSPVRQTLLTRFKRKEGGIGRRTTQSEIFDPVLSLTFWRAILPPLYSASAAAAFLSYRSAAVKERSLKI